MSASDIRDIDFTEAAWESLYDVVDDTVFLEQDAEIIYDSLKHRLKFISFGDYLKRYIYLKAEIERDFLEVPLKEYQLIIQHAFADNHTPVSFKATTAKLSALSKNWLTQQTVKRSVVFLLGFGLNMSVEDVNIFLTKALREHEINSKNPFEVICWYCYKKRFNYLKFTQLWEDYCVRKDVISIDDGDCEERTIGVQKHMHSINSDEELFAYLTRCKLQNGAFWDSNTARECFYELYNDARDLIVKLYNHTEEEHHNENVHAYQERLSRNVKLYDYEKRAHFEAFRKEKKRFVREDITESDIEHVICSAIPLDKHGNLSPSKLSKLNEQFAGKRFSRQRINEILSGNTEITRFDLITLNFFIYSQKTSLFSNAKSRYRQFWESTNMILKKCFMGELYVQNPYECFVLMCILSVDPLGTYAEVWELSYKNEA